MLPVVLKLQLANLAVATVALLHFEPHLQHILLGLRQLCIFRLHLLSELGAFGSGVGVVVGLRGEGVTLSAGRRKEGVK
jgi:hypothetical protein